MISLTESGHFVFRGTSALGRGLLTSKGGGGNTFETPQGDSATAELLFHIVISVNHFKVYESVSDWCEWRICSAYFWSLFNQYRNFCCGVGWWIGIQSRETGCVNTTKDSNFFPKTFEWAKLAKTLASWERFLVVNILWQFMTLNWQESDIFIILFTVLLVFLIVQRLYSRRDMRIDFDMLHITGCLKSWASWAKWSVIAQNLSSW